MPVVVVADEVLFLIDLVVNAAVVVDPDIIKLFAVKDVAPVPPAATGNVPEVTVPDVPVYKALLEAVPTFPSLVIFPCACVETAKLAVV